MAVNLLKPIAYNNKIVHDRSGTKSKLFAFVELLFFVLFAASASAALMITNMILDVYVRNSAIN